MDNKLEIVFDEAGVPVDEARFEHTGKICNEKRKEKSFLDGGATFICSFANRLLEFCMKTSKTDKQQAQHHINLFNECIFSKTDQIQGWLRGDRIVQNNDAILASILADKTHDFEDYCGLICINDVIWRGIFKGQSHYKKDEYNFKIEEKCKHGCIITVLLTMNTETSKVTLTDASHKHRCGIIYMDYVSPH